MKAHTLVTAIGLVLGVGTASAADIFITSTSATSDDFNVISTNVDAVSTYDPAGSVASADALIGQTAVPFSDTSTGGEINGLLVGTTPLLSGDAAGFLTDYRLLFDYTVSGTAAFVDGSAFGGALPPDGTLDGYNNSTYVVGSDGLIDPWDAIAPTFQTGLFEITYEAATAHSVFAIGDTLKLLEMSLASAETSGANVTFFTVVDYAWYDPTDALLNATQHALIQDFWNFSSAIVINGTPYNSFYDIWLAGLSSAVPIEIVMRSDFNVDPNDVPTCVGASPCDTLSRDTNLNVTSIVFSQAVPVPGTVALLGLGLVGLAGFRRRFFA